MPLIPPNEIEAVLESVDLLDLVGETVDLRRSGREFLGLCPFHDESNPSFRVDADKGLFYCFGCQVGGNVIQFLQRRDGLTFPEAVRRLQDRVHEPTLTAETAVPLHSRANAHRQFLVERETDRRIRVIKRRIYELSGQLDPRQREVSQTPLADSVLRSAERQLAEAHEELNRHLAERDSWMEL